MTATELIESLKNNKISILTKEHFQVDFSSDELDLMVSYLLLSTAVEAIELENTDINPNILKILSDGLTYDTSIKSLKLNNVTNIEKYIPELKEIIQFNTGIETIGDFK